MKEVTNLKKSKVDEGLVSVLKLLLSKAESGEMNAILFVDAYTDNTTGMGWSGRPTRAMIGQFEELKFDYFSKRYIPVNSE